MLRQLSRKEPPQGLDAGAGTVHDPFKAACRAGWHAFLDFQSVVLAKPVHIISTRSRKAVRWLESRIQGQIDHLGGAADHSRWCKTMNTWI